MLKTSDKYLITLNDDIDNSDSGTELQKHLNTCIEVITDIVDLDPVQCLEIIHKSFQQVISRFQQCRTVLQNGKLRLANKFDD